jgi:hypothetical protein
VADYEGVDVDIVEFLRARLDEDEAAARAARNALPWKVRSGPGDDGGWETEVGPARMLFSDDEPAAEHIARWQPERALREVEAKRRVISDHDRAEFCDQAALGQALYVLAAVWSDHPDYQEDWPPDYEW